MIMQEYKCPKVMKTPTQFLDLNSIENLWNKLNLKIWETPNNKLRERLQVEWSKISVKYLIKIIMNISIRFQYVVKNNGYVTHFKYFNKKETLIFCSCSKTFVILFESNQFFSIFFFLFSLLKWWVMVKMASVRRFLWHAAFFFYKSN